MYKIGTLAKKSGYSPNLLRVWEKRYGFLQPLRGSGGQRLYPEEDLNLLRVIRSELEKGRSIGELALLGRAQLLLASGMPVAGSGPARQPQHGFGEQGEYGDFIGPIVEAAVALDLTALTRSLDAAFSRLSPDVVVHKVIATAMERIGDEWMKGTVTVAGEHMVSSLIEYRLRNLLEASGPRMVASPTQSPVICACFPGEEHRIGLLSVAYCLARQGLTVLYLGASLPFSALEVSIHQLGVGSVWLSVTSPEIFQSNRRQFLNLLTAYPAVRFILGGQAVTAEDEELSTKGCHVCPYPCSVPKVILSLMV
ncbi:MAG: cobalamin B12-binding domain-containing protein [Proteobacteria bacterium]|nr:cobalamin B12-binding domain-containing protein [Pseudomonadota bacterium]MBU4295921.1 cobalamin B12-binding domain-containing protein [Pseudomonadota bacterium]MCG2748348.1 cobalamin B12-binding domain-containing protein [Desulfobulbaceae bacterium]